MTTENPEIMTLDRVAAVFHVEPSTVRKWTQRGLPVVERGTRGGARRQTMIDLRAAVEWYFRTHHEQLELDRARTRLANEQANTAALRNAETQRDLVPLEMVEAASSQLVAEIRRVAEAIPATACIQLEALTVAERKAVLDRHMFDFLDRVVAFRPSAEPPRET